ncbi:hypothetical protein EC968_006961 [Mortierella alpina]|nr:hypothetical protein EC968_006961 [Mortierella alpina]
MTDSATLTPSRSNCGAPTGTPSANGHQNSGSEQHATPQSTPQPERSSRQPREQPRTSDPHQDIGEHHPELDDFVSEFYDGDKFTDVDSRVWV